MIRIKKLKKIFCRHRKREIKYMISTPGGFLMVFRCLECGKDIRKAPDENIDIKT